MKIAFFSIILNNHQRYVADELWEMTGHSFCFVELLNLSGIHRKGDEQDYSHCPYLLQAWKGNDEKDKAMEIALSAEAAFFGSVESFHYLNARLKKGLLSFDFGERWMKRGWINLLSPRIMKMLLFYKLGGWDNKPVFKLCNGAYVAEDQYKLNTYKGKCYKWGYFPGVKRCEIEEVIKDSSEPDCTSIMWCSRYLKWKHPELPIYLASVLKGQGYRVRMDMYGEGIFKDPTIKLAKDLGVDDIVDFYGNYPNEELTQIMGRYEIFLFTSDKREGWGAVLNESMSNGCAVISSMCAGAAPYLIEDGVTGLKFKSPDIFSGFKAKGVSVDKESLSSLCGCVKAFLNDKALLLSVRINASKLLQEVWSPRKAAQNLLQMVNDFQQGNEVSIIEGPCSKEIVIRTKDLYA